MNWKRGWVYLVVILLAAVACQRPALPTTTQATSTTQPQSQTSQPAETATPAEPSPTPEPLAALVNGEGITLAEYQAELQRYQAAQGADLTPEDSQRVLDDLVNQTLLAQAAQENSFKLDEADLQARLEQLTSLMGGEEELTLWMESNHYTEESLRQGLRRSMSAAWMRDQIAASVPLTADQVHARQIRTNTLDEANQILAELQAGGDFTDLATVNDPVTRGELDWFPRGFLLDSRLEEAAFSLQPGQYSDVIETEAGFYILQVVEREAQHPLGPQALLMAQEQALQNWLLERRDQSQIQTFVP